MFVLVGGETGLRYGEVAVRDPYYSVRGGDHERRLIGDHYAPHDQKLPPGQVRKGRFPLRHARDGELRPANRPVIAYRTRKVFADVLPGTHLSLIYDVSHNIRKEEWHTVDGQTRRLYVHRKGAMCAPSVLSVMAPGAPLAVTRLPPVVRPGAGGRARQSGYPDPCPSLRIALELCPVRAVESAGCAVRYMEEAAEHGRNHALQ